MPIAYLLTGGNLGEPQRHLQQAATTIQQEAGKIISASAIYQTAAWGLSDQPDFLNQVLQVETNLAAPELLHCLLNIEMRMGRLRLQKNGPRIIDIDILFYGNAIIHQPDLTIPHPVLHLRRFVLVPLAQIAPTLPHPVLQKTIVQLLEECTDPLVVKKFHVED
jgi:2-amino-4-hydroxy-6-hydroxymethyldihydropteridine diphosphokinase